MDHECKYYNILIGTWLYLIHIPTEFELSSKGEDLEEVTTFIFSQEMFGLNMKFLKTLSNEIEFLWIDW